MDYKRVGMQIGLAVFVAAASWTVGPNVAEAAPVKPIVSTASFKANLEKSFLVADDTDDLSTRITTDRLNVRSGPSTGHNILGVLDTGTTVKANCKATGSASHIMVKPLIYMPTGCGLHKHPHGRRVLRHRLQKRSPAIPPRTSMFVPVREPIPISWVYCPTEQKLKALQ